MESGSGSWVYVSSGDRVEEEWIDREGRGRCRVNERGVREWWKGCILLSGGIRFERLMGKWERVFVVEE